MENEGCHFRIRVAEESDAQAVHDIYGYYTEHTAATFTDVNPDADHYREKIRTVKERYPFYVAESTEDGRILGYIYGSPLRPHDAYRWDVEATIFLAPDTPRRKGIGSALYRAFTDALTAQGYRYVFGVITDSNEESILMHRALGFEEVGHFTKVGYKAGKWHGIVWMRKQIGALDEDPQEPLAFEQKER